VDRIQVDLHGQDTIRLKNGTEITGKITKVAFSGAGGVLNFKRERIQQVVVGGAPPPTAREQFKKRWDALRPDDAVGFYRLGVWCRARQLSAEARRCLEKSLALDPKHEFARDAHEALGHSLQEGRWITAEEKQQLLEKTSQTTGLVKYHGHWRTKKDIEQRKKREAVVEEKAKVKLAEVGEKFSQKLTALNEEAAGATGSLEQKLKAATDEVDQCQRDLDWIREERKRRFGRISGGRPRDFNPSKDRVVRTPSGETSGRIRARMRRSQATKAAAEKRLRAIRRRTAARRRDLKADQESRETLVRSIAQRLLRKVRTADKVPTEEQIDKYFKSRLKS